MAAVTSATAAASALTPPTSSHGDELAWGYREKTNADYNGSSHVDRPVRSPTYPYGGPSASEYHHDPQTSSRKMPSADDLYGSQWNGAGGSGVASPTMTDFKTGRSNSVDGLGLIHPSHNDAMRGTSGAASPETESDESKWIHRDKLAKIESEELQAAGIFIPRARAPSKQRRDRSQSRLRRGTDASEQSRSRSRKNSTAVEQRAVDTAQPVWDLRTPEEIAEEEANAYFSANAGKGGSRIPVAKTSPAPIPLDYLDRSGARKLSESPDDDQLLYPKTRARSASGGARDLEFANGGGGAIGGKRSVTDTSNTSPKKTPAGSRKSSAPSKPPSSGGRPKTRSGQGRDASSTGGTRPSTRSGELKQPEGDPPWMVNSYKPDPRLPPDQQLLPTVARRLQQEKWEKEGKFGDVYDKDFRPLNDNVFLKPPESEKAGASDEDQQPQADEWPLKPEALQKSPEPPKSPVTTRPGSYSTMPKIADKANMSPLPSPLAASAPQQPANQQQPRAEAAPQTAQDKQEEKEEKGGCGCCVVM